MRMLKVSFLIGVLNEIDRLPRAVDSIRKQDYPGESIEIVVADGGSTDGTIEYAESAGCRVVHNPLRRCEPGLALGYAQASGDVAVFMAADNVLHDERFVRQIVAPFQDANVAAAMPRVINTGEDCITTRYLNDFTDPFSHFVYGASANPSTFARAYPVKRSTGEYVIYDFKDRPRPLVALAQAMALRTGLPRRAGTEEDDIAPILDIVERGGDIAYVPAAQVEHHSVAGLSDYLSKMGPRIAERLRSSDHITWKRIDRRRDERQVRAYVWPVYAVSVLFPAMVAAYGLARDRKLTWAYHPIISFALASTLLRQMALHALASPSRRRSPT